MRNILLILIFGFIASCSSGRYLLTDNNRDKKYLIDYIKDLENQGKITDKPLIVIDGLAFGYENLKANKLPLSKDDIFKIDCLSKDNEGATNIYGEGGRNGVLLILTKKSQEVFQEKSSKPLTDKESFQENSSKSISDQESFQEKSSESITDKERIQEKSSKSLEDSKLLFLMGDKQITQEEFQKIDLHDIVSIEVLKDKDSMRKYTSEDYDGIVIITMKIDKK